MPANSDSIRYHAPYMEWAKTREAAELDLAGSNILACSIDDLPGAPAAMDLAGANDNGYRPLVEAIGARYGVNPDLVTTAGGTSGANFLVLAALLEPGDDVLVERPGYDALLGAARLFGARTIRFDRAFDAGFALDPDRVRRAMTPRTKVIVITSPHNPTGVIADPAALDDCAAAGSSRRPLCRTACDARATWSTARGRSSPSAWRRSPFSISTL